MAQLMHIFFIQKCKHSSSQTVLSLLCICNIHSLWFVVNIVLCYDCHYLYAVGPAVLTGVLGAC